MSAAPFPVQTASGRRNRAARGHGATIVLSGICLALISLAVIGPLLAPYSPTDTDLLSVGQSPSADHWLGTDSLGRDIFSRLLHGARLSFAGAGIIVLVSATLGTLLAIAAAWFSGVLDTVVKSALNVIFSVPGILVAILASAAFGAGFWAPVIALSIVYVPYGARVVRSVAVRECARPYVEALRLAGVPAWRICTGHVLRNVFPIVVAQATVGFGFALVDFGAINFLGLGVQAPHSEWGLMVSDGRSEILDGAMLQSLSAGLLIVVTVVSFNLLGSRLVLALEGTDHGR